MEAAAGPSWGLSTQQPKRPCSPGVCLHTPFSHSPPPSTPRRVPSVAPGVSETKSPSLEKVPPRTFGLSTACGIPKAPQHPQSLHRARPRPRDGFSSSVSVSAITTRPSAVRRDTENHSSPPFPLLLTSSRCVKVLRFVVIFSFFFLVYFGNYQTSRKFKK